MFEMVIFKSAQVIKRYVMFAFLFVHTDSVCEVERLGIYCESLT